MASVISQRDLRNDSGEIMRRVDAGETFVVTRNGTPIAELSPLRRQRFVSAEAVAALFRGSPGIDAALLREDLDSAVNQDAETRG